MLFQVGLTLEPHATELTGVRGLSRVLTHVRLEAGRDLEGRAANFTLERLLSGVYPHMNFERALVSEPSVAFLALKRDVTLIMDTHVLSVVAGVME